ncbi:MAG: hypothetical protein ABSB96_05980 [Gaiellaceae bacterium]
MIAGVPENVEVARQQWQEGYRRFQTLAGEPASRDRLYLELETISDELRRRIGQTFTMAEVAEVYGDAERWATATVAERAPVRGWSRDLATVLDAAFCLYARAAVDYLP